MKKFIVTVIAGLAFSSSAFAWGEREQGALAGIAGLWAFQQIQRAGQPQVIYQQTPPVIVQQPQVIIQQSPIYSYPIRNYYSCLVQVQDPYSGIIRNEVRTCVQ
jgi:hypothetical protein